MGFPTTRIDDIRVGEMRTATAGSLVSVLRQHKVVTGLALGAADAPADQLLVETDGVPWVYAIDAMGATRALHVNDASGLVLDIGDDDVDGNRLPNYVGCLGLTTEGLVVCAAAGRDGFREYAQVFVSLTTHRLLETRHELLLGAVWFTNWSLSYRDPTDRLTRLVGNPQWPDAVRLQR
jgi:hypothetical protein